jgi:hypothetical protein
MNNRRDLTYQYIVVFFASALVVLSLATCAMLAAR